MDILAWQIQSDWLNSIKYHSFYLCIGCGATPKIELHCKTCCRSNPPRPPPLPKTQTTTKTAESTFSASNSNSKSRIWIKIILVEIMSSQLRVTRPPFVAPSRPTLKTAGGALSESAAEVKSIGPCAKMIQSSPSSSAALSLPDPSLLEVTVLIYILVKFVHACWTAGKNFTKPHSNLISELCTYFCVNFEVT